MINRYDIITLDNHECNSYLVGDGFKKRLGPVIIPDNVQPHTEATLAIPTFDVSEHKGEVYLQLDFSLKKDTLWCKSGHVTSTSQLQVQAPSSIPAFPAASASSAPTVKQNPTALTINTSTSTLTLSL
ncbi:DUF4981 domain-containing protein, partial [Staphylococcus hominis]|uniref:DUF4981 domain-containing protein n=1 Tax=Staphylococcus hominis TaxID=1290 RepID=UPI0039BF14CD